MMIGQKSYGNRKKNRVDFGRIGDRSDEDLLHIGGKSSSDRTILKSDENLPVKNRTQIVVRSDGNFYKGKF